MLLIPLNHTKQSLNPIENRWKPLCCVEYSMADFPIVMSLSHTVLQLHRISLPFIRNSPPKLLTLQRDSDVSITRMPLFLWVFSRWSTANWRCHDMCQVNAGYLASRTIIWFNRYWEDCYIAGDNIDPQEFDGIYKFAGIDNLGFPLYHKRHTTFSQFSRITSLWLSVTALIGPAFPFGITASITPNTPTYMVCLQTAFLNVQMDIRGREYKHELHLWLFLVNQRVARLHLTFRFVSPGLHQFWRTKARNNRT